MYRYRNENELNTTQTANHTKVCAARKIAQITPPKSKEAKKVREAKEQRGWHQLCSIIAANAPAEQNCRGGNCGAISRYIDAPERTDRQGVGAGSWIRLLWSAFGASHLN